MILDPTIHSTDDWFTTKDGEYMFDKRFLSRAHTETTTRVMEDLFLGKDVIVANTFINYWEIAPYIWLAKLAGVDCIVYEPDVVYCPEASLTVQHNDESLLTYKMYERCVHGVPPDIRILFSAAWTSRLFLVAACSITTLRFNSQL